MEKKNEAGDRTYLRSKRICIGGRDCKRVAVKYLGEPAAPQNVRYIRQRAQDSGIGRGQSQYALSLTEGIGFKGNTTYPLLYGTRFLPSVEIHEGPEY